MLDLLPGPLLLAANYLVLSALDNYATDKAHLQEALLVEEPKTKIFLHNRHQIHKSFW